jgi:hypothetical protein
MEFNERLSALLAPHGVPAEKTRTSAIRGHPPKGKRRGFRPAAFA